VNDDNRIIKFSYVGTELELFAKAINWENYVGRKLWPYIAGSVIEVGAGLGGSKKYLCDRSNSRWPCLDPDENHVSHLKNLIAAGTMPPCCEARCGVLPISLATNMRIRSSISMFWSTSKMTKGRCASQPLISRRGGHIVMLSPAFNFLYSPFDKAIEHYRRYITKDAGRLTIPPLILKRVFFLDSLECFVSAVNRLVMRTSQPSIHQIQFWDKAIVPVSVLTDKIFGRLFGRSVVMIWQKK
jgi:hypothetical protein